MFDFGILTIALIVASGALWSFSETDWPDGGAMA